MPRKNTTGYCRLPLAVLILVLFCSGTVMAAATAAAACPSGCSCLQPDVAREKGYDACGGQLSACGYDQYQKTMYCYRTPKLAIPLRTLQTLVVATTTTAPAGNCPAGCSCMLEADAKEKFGTYSRCSETPCYSVVTGSTTLKAYCFRQGTPPVTTTPAMTCPNDCSCLTDAVAKEKFGTYTRCSETVCGYDIPTNTLAAYQVPKYCVKGGTTIPVCPEGCSCLTDAQGKEKFGTYARCSETVCGYDMPANTVAAYQVPKYCMKQGTTTPVCPEGCSCLTDAQGKERFGTYTRCSETVCGYDIPANTVAAYQVPKYCMKQGTTIPACPDSCTCVSDEVAKLKGLTHRCDNSQTPCGYEAAVAGTNQQVPQYCYKLPATTAVCPQGCDCLTNATGVEKGLSFCGGKVTLCGYNENNVARHCFATTSTASCTYDYQKGACDGTCQQGYSCTLVASKKDESGKVVYGACRCTGQSSVPCSFDYQKNSCAGTCQTGAACTVTGKQVDGKTGAVSVICGCPQQSACTYNYDKDTCDGSCPVTGDACQLNTIYRDPASGKVTYGECQCKGTGNTCSCDAAKGTCSGTCPGGQACTVTERSADAAGAVVCKSCGCTNTCVLSANNECSGTCTNQQPCTRIVAKDESGNEKVSCGCTGISQAGGTTAAVATRQPGFLDGFTSFFNRLFGGK